MLYIHVRDHDIQLLFADVSKKFVKVKKAILEELPSALIVNGFVQNDEAFQKYLLAIVKKHQLAKAKVVLTIDSTFVVYREMSTPILSKRELDKYVFYTLKQQINLIQDYTVDYAILKKDKKYQVLTIAAPNSLLVGYKTAFQLAKLQIERITTTPLNLVRGFARSGQASQLASSIYLYYNGDIISSVLFNKSDYIFSSVYRTFHPINPENAMMERVSQLMQFQRSQNHLVSVEQVSMFGEIDESRFEAKGKVLGTLVYNENYRNVFTTMASMSPNTLSSFMAVAFATLPSKQRNYNLNHGLDQSLYTVGQDKKEKYAFLGLILIANMVLVGVLGVVAWRNVTIQQERVRVLQDRNNNPTLLKHQMTALSLTATNALRENQLKEYEQVGLSLASTKLFTYEMYGVVKSLLPSDVSWSNLNYSSDRVTLQLTAKNRTSPFTYVYNLRHSELFSDVLYTGFGESEGGYSFQIELVLKAGEVQ